MSAAWIAPVAVLGYFALLFFLSDRIARVLGTTFLSVILIGIFLPPIWLIMAFVSLFYWGTGTKAPVRRVEIVTKKKSPKRKAKKTK